MMMCRLSISTHKYKSPHTQNRQNITLILATLDVVYADISTHSWWVKCQCRLCGCVCGFTMDLLVFLWQALVYKQAQGSSERWSWLVLCPKFDVMQDRANQVVFFFFFLSADFRGWLVPSWKHLWCVQQLLAVKKLKWRSNFKEGNMISVQESGWKEVDWNGWLSYFIFCFRCPTACSQVWPCTHHQEQWYNMCGRNCESTKSSYNIIITKSAKQQ